MYLGLFLSYCKTVCYPGRLGELVSFRKREGAKVDLRGSPSNSLVGMVTISFFPSVGDKSGDVG